MKDKTRGKWEIDAIRIIMYDKYAREDYVRYTIPKLCRHERMEGQILYYIVRYWK